MARWRSLFGMMAAALRRLAVPGLAFALAACATTPPSPAPTSVIDTPAVTTAPAPSGAAPTATTAAPTLAPADPASIFTPLDSGHWVLAATADNLGRIGQTSVLHQTTETMEVRAACSGTGTIRVNIIALDPATPTDPDTTVTLVDQTLDCPDVPGQLVDTVGTAVVGSWVNIDVAPSDPQIRYEVLVGTVEP